jgi:leucyl-tRNA synthetase
MADKFEPKKFEEKWREMWKKEGTYKTKEIKDSKSKFYSLYSFPYPSGAGLHVGHVEGMVANDIPARFHRMQGKAVMMPMGWDSFGLPAENYAIKTGIHPGESTESAVVTFKKQIDEMGISVDWETEVGAHRESYYKWTQWIFLQLYKKGLAYKKKAPVNWCPQDQTVLANEQVLNDGTCERCGTKVIQKEMSQWFFKITDYADRLVDDLDKVDWPESTKIQQREWIGRSEGANIRFQVISDQGTEVDQLEVFSTAFDTIYGATFMVIAPEHKMITNHESLITNYDEVKKYLENAKTKTELERQQQKDKTGVELKGIKAINPVNNKQIPIFVADYVLGGYGTGSIMAVPAHDERDGEFAKKYGLEIVPVVKEGQDEFISYTNDVKKNPKVYTAINSDQFDGMDYEKGREAIMKFLEEKSIAERKVEFRLRDWLVSRQRYWGCPIPIVYDPEGNEHPVDEKDLPVKLPTDVDFKPTGESPLVHSESFHKSAEEKYGKGWRREVDTMDTFVDSSWYYFRHLDAANSEKVFDSEKINNWLPTDLYMIGAEHIVLHLLYSRFFTKFLYDEGIINFDEPFYKMRHMGLVLGPDGRKMSKRWGNVINPTDEVNKFGADTLRMYEMFMGPLQDPKAWNDRAEAGVFRFLTKIWIQQDKVSVDVKSDQQEREINKLIKKVEEDIQSMSFNTAIAKMMEFANFIQREKEINRSVWERFMLVIAPFAPYISEELWSRLGNEFSIHNAQWPSFNPEMVKDETVEIGVQVNGKMRGTIEISVDDEQEVAMEKAMAQESISKYIPTEPKKVIYVKGRILNVIV